MPEITRIQPVVPSFTSVEALREGLDAKSRFEPVDLYPRDGSRILGEVEAQIADLVGFEQDEVLSYTSGMSAVTAAIDTGLYFADIDDRTPTIACALETYTQSQRFLHNFLKGVRANIAPFDSNDTGDLARVIKTHSPDVIVAETVGNYLGVPVLDVDFALQSAREQPNKPMFVLDNTLPLSTGVDMVDRITPDDNVIVVESGTKSYSFNAETLGVAYTKNEKLLDHLRRYRRTRGDLHGPRSLEIIAGCLPVDQEAFDERNKKLFSNTGRAALTLFETLGTKSDFAIFHPDLPNHDQHQYYREHIPDGGAPVMYVHSRKHDQIKIIKALWDNKEVQEQSLLGQSFGFDEARLVYDENLPMVRIAGGADTDGQALGQACAEALKQIQQ